MQDHQEQQLAGYHYQFTMLRHIYTRKPARNVVPRVYV